ncbi:MAG: lactoylglutathione lyase [Actinomycetia bacterium]|nr:lactoylglutathione lyase [Actinomycetes bacterium]
MELKGVHHVSINIGDLDENVRFYTEVLGMNLMESRPDNDIPVDGAWLDLPDGRELHLLCRDSEPAPGQHFAYEVADLDAVIAELEGHGVKVSAPAELGGICRQSFAKDPSGNLLEFNQQI